ncbi:hypothetical protein GCM10027422_10840 [Hymenobacter arcticus]
MYDNAGYRLETYREYIEKIFLQEPELYALRSIVPGYPRIATFIYYNVPENKHITGITYGLSEYDNAAWIAGRPELIISVRSSDESWGRAAGLAAARFQMDSDFAYGTILDFEHPISSDSEMQAFFLFAPSILEPVDYTEVKLDYYTVNIVGLYPIYKEEISTIQKIGLERFMKHPDYNMFSVNRKVIRV